MHFRIIGQSVVNPAWTGAPQTLAYHDSVTMPQTPDGSMILGYWNTSGQNNDGTLALTSGGAPPLFLDVPALANQPSLLVQNWKANDLKLTNLSANTATPIRVQAFGPGIPGTQPAPLTIGTAKQLAVLQTAQGTAKPNWMQLVLESNTDTLTIVALVGGPLDPSSGTNGYVFALNFSGSTAPPGYTAVTGGNTYTYQFNWGSSSVFVANMSPQTAAPVKVTLLTL